MNLFCKIIFPLVMKMNLIYITFKLDLKSICFPNKLEPRMFSAKVEYEGTTIKIGKKTKLYNIYGEKMVIPHVRRC